MAKKKDTPTERSARATAPSQGKGDSKHGSRQSPRDAREMSSEARPTDVVKNQLEKFNEAIEKFQAGDFQGARKLFEVAAGGRNLAIAQTARMHISMCAQRLSQPSIELKTAEDHYNYAIGLINSRNVDSAAKHLRTALELNNSADHIHYALALALGLQGNLDDAASHLTRAIQLNPANRNLARRDPDFSEIWQEPPLRDLLSGEAAEPT